MWQKSVDFPSTASKTSKSERIAPNLEGSLYDSQSDTLEHDTTSKATGLDGDIIDVLDKYYGKGQTPKVDIKKIVEKTYETPQSTYGLTDEQLGISTPSFPSEAPESDSAFMEFWKNKQKNNEDDDITHLLEKTGDEPTK